MMCLKNVDFVETKKSLRKMESEELVILLPHQHETWKDIQEELKKPILSVEDLQDLMLALRTLAGSNRKGRCHLGFFDIFKPSDVLHSFLPSHNPAFLDRSAAFHSAVGSENRGTFSRTNTPPYPLKER